MIYFENAQLEFFGTPMAYFPYFSTPDPTVKRKSGFLYPVALYSSIYGVGIQIPYYWALAPDYDLTITPRLMIAQGVLMKGEWRQRLDSGYYTIALSGIYQLDKDYFLDEVRHDELSELSRLPRQPSRRAAVSPSPTNGTGAGTALLPTDSTLLLGLRAFELSARTRISSSTGFTEGLAGLHHRPRQPQLFRCAQHLLLRLLRSRRAEPDSDHPPGGRLLLHLRPAGVRRRTRLPHQPDEPEPQHRVVRSHLAVRQRHRRLRTGQRRSRWPRSRPTVCCAAFRATTAASPPRRTGSAPITDPIGQQWTPFASLRGDAMHDVDRKPDRRFQLHRARRPGRSPRHADRRPRVPISVHQRAVLGHADHRRRSRRSSCGRTRPRSASCRTKTRKA